LVNQNELWASSAADLSAGYANGAFSPVDAFESVAARIEAVNPRLNAVVTLDLAGARRAAQESALRWRAGTPLSMLDGVPITVKDNIVVRGMRATWGSALYSEFVPSADELPVARLRAAGVVIFGKTNCPEFTVHGYTDNLLFGPTRNPWNLALTPGGSSGGAVAAVSAGLCPIALATDGGGSIRRPASYTGLVGLKPSRGRVARADGFAPVLHECEVVGPIARTIEDVRLVMRIIGLPDSRDPLSTQMKEDPFESKAPPACRILYVPSFNGSPVDPAIAHSVAQAARALESLGHRIDVGSEPFDMDALGQSWSVVSQAGLSWLMGSHDGWEQRVGEEIRKLVASGFTLSASQYYEALMQCAKLRRELEEVFGEYDMIMTPSAAAMPWPAAEVFPSVIDGCAVGPRGHAVFTAFVNMAGSAALNLPAAPAPGGMPIGFQLVGPICSDALLCNVGAQYQAECLVSMPWPAL
jgi:aspartyl-tRNA(Asn)/glutamyl-tRNA(Gln) amidotransferase subunit A